MGDGGTGGGGIMCGGGGLVYTCSYFSVSLHFTLCTLYMNVAHFPSF